MNVNYKAIMMWVAIASCIATPVGIGIGMRVKDAQHDLQITQNQVAIGKLQTENKELKEKLDKTKDDFQEDIDELGVKIDGIPQKVFNLMISVKQAKE